MGEEVNSFTLASFHPFTLLLFPYSILTHKLSVPTHDHTTEPTMPVPQELLDILVCPVCKAPVKPTPDNAGLKCQSCRRVYPVRDEIPVMLPEEATIAGE